MAKKNHAAILRADLLTAPERTNYFAGRLLGVDDYAREQEYHRRKQRLLNLAALGPGVVTGLKVKTARGGVRVSAGYAIDDTGREVIVPEDVDVAAPAGRSRWWYVIAWAEDVGTQETPSMDERGVQHGVIREVGRVVGEANAPGKDDGRIVLKRVARRAR